MHTESWLENLKGDIAISSWRILKWFLKKQSMMLWTEFMTQYMVPWWAPVNVVMTVWFHNWEHSFKELLLSL
jgi:hypothetical protein